MDRSPFETTWPFAMRCAPIPRYYFYGLLKLRLSAEVEDI